MKAIVFAGKDKIQVEDVGVPEIKEGFTRIRVSHAGICGSDMTIYFGKHPRAKAPLILGHEFSGYIDSSHPSLPLNTLVAVYPHLACGTCDRCLNGQFHVCSILKIIGIDLDGGMAEYALVPNEYIYPVAPGVSPKLAAFTEPVSISVHTVRKGDYCPGDSVAVFGAGAIGLSTALTFRHFGAENIVICEPNPKRLELARSMGFNTINPKTDDVIKAIYSRTGGLGADYVIDCAGHQSVIDLLPDAVKINGKIIIVAGYKEPPAMNFQKGMFREFSIQFVRNSTRKDFEIAGSLVKELPEYERLINMVLPVEQAQTGFDLLASPSDAMKVMFSFEK